MCSICTAAPLCWDGVGLGRRGAAILGALGVRSSASRPGPGDSFHFFRGVAKEAETTWRQPGLALDPDHPEYLLYSQVLGRRVLVGVMYMMPLGVEGPQLGGARTVWHFHLFPAGLCFVGGVVPVGNRNAGGGCTAGAAPRHRSAEMMHVWLLPPPVSPFASSMECPLEATSDGTPEGNLRTAEAAPGPKRKQVSPEERFRKLLPSLLERRMKEHGF